MGRNNLVIRADASDKIGYGHVYRSIALLQMVRHDFKCVFVSHNKMDFLENELLELDTTFILSEKLIDYPFTDERIAGEEVVFDMNNILTGKEIVVIDGYWFGSQYQRAIKDKGCKLVCIDDLHDVEFYADLIINHAPGISKNDYTAQKYTRFALGLDYALLREPFLIAAKENTNKNKFDTTLVCFGGSDAKNYTQKAVEALQKISFLKKILVVTGNSYMHNDKLNHMQMEDPRIQLYNSINPYKMVTLLGQAGFVVVSASTVLLEALCCHCKIISIWYSNNQKFFCEYLEKHNIIYSLGDNRSDFDSEKLLDIIHTQIRNKGDETGHLVDRISKVRENIRTKFLEISET